jgi:hypothetical protein
VGSTPIPQVCASPADGFLKIKFRQRKLFRYLGIKSRANGQTANGRIAILEIVSIL